MSCAYLSDAFKDPPHPPAFLNLPNTRIVDGGAGPAVLLCADRQCQQAWISGDHGCSSITGFESRPGGRRTLSPGQSQTNQSSSAQDAMS